MKSYLLTMLSLLLTVVVCISWCISHWTKPTEDEVEGVCIQISGTQYVHERVLHGKDKLYLGTTLVCEAEEFSEFVLCKEMLFFNSFEQTTFGSSRCDIVCIAPNGHEADLFMRDTMLYGIAGDSLLIIKKGYAAPPFPKYNSLRLIWYFSEEVYQENAETQVAQYYNLDTQQIVQCVDLAEFSYFDLNGVYLPDAQTVIPWADLIREGVGK